jgi:cytochrome c
MGRLAAADASPRRVGGVVSHAFVPAAILTGAMAIAGCHAEKEPAAAAVERGKRIASTCSNCHALTAERNKIGPHLVAVLGRKAGTVRGYTYSEGMKRYGRDWTPDRMVAFLQDPRGVVPQTKMGISPLRPDQARDVVSYIRSLE